MSAKSFLSSIISDLSHDDTSERPGEYYAKLLLHGEYSPSYARELANFLKIPDGKFRDFDLFLMTLHWGVTDYAKLKAEEDNRDNELS